MKYINVFETEEAYNASAGNLAKPQLSYIKTGKMYSISAGSQPGPTPTINWIDLELPSGTLWADRNIGATCEDTSLSWYGKYYAWGEIETKTNYSWNTYKHCDKDDNNPVMTKYTDINTSILQQEDDTAYANGQLKMPTKEQCQELINGTNSSWIENYNNIEGLNGILFISKTIENASIFIPAAGTYVESEIYVDSIVGVIWINSLDFNDIYCAYSMCVTEEDVYINSEISRYRGLSVRGVKNL